MLATYTQDVGSGEGALVIPAGLAGNVAPGLPCASGQASVTASDTANCSAASYMISFTVDITAALSPSSRRRALQAADDSAAAGFLAAFSGSAPPSSVTPLQAAAAKAIVSLSTALSAPQTDAAGNAVPTALGAQLGPWLGQLGSPSYTGYLTSMNVNGVSVVALNGTNALARASVLAGLPVTVVSVGSVGGGGAGSSNTAAIAGAAAGAALFIIAAVFAAFIVARRRRRARVLARAKDTFGAKTTANPLAAGGSLKAAGATRKASAPRGFTVNPLRANPLTADIISAQRETGPAQPSFTANPLCAAGLVTSPTSLPSLPLARAKSTSLATAASVAAMPPSGSAAVAAMGAGGAFARAASMRDLPVEAATADTRSAAAAAAARARFAPTTSDGEVDDEGYARAEFANPLHGSNDGSGSDGQRVRSGVSGASLNTAQKLIRQATVFDSDAMAHAARGKGGATSVVDKRGRRAFAVQAVGAINTASASDVASGPRPLPPHWAELLDASSGNVYYHNSSTKETVWARPTDAAEETAPQRSAADVFRAARPLPAVAASAAVVAAPAEPLPPHWAELLDASTGGVYYHNELTNETSWERPAEAATGRSGDGDGVPAGLGAHELSVAGVEPTAAVETGTEAEAAFASAFAAASAAAAAATNASSLRNLAASAVATDARRAAAAAAAAPARLVQSDADAEAKTKAAAETMVETAVEADVDAQAGVETTYEAEAAEAAAKVAAETAAKAASEAAAEAELKAEVEARAVAAISEAVAEVVAAASTSAAAAAEADGATSAEAEAEPLTEAPAAVAAGAEASAAAAEAVAVAVAEADASSEAVAAAAAGAGAEAAAEDADAEPAAIAGWTKTWSKTHSTYYWREDSSGATSWEKPTPTPEGWVQDTVDVRRHSNVMSRPRRSASRRFSGWKQTDE